MNFSHHREEVRLSFQFFHPYDVFDSQELSHKLMSTHSNGVKLILTLALSRFNRLLELKREKNLKFMQGAFKSD
jgi:hypothetical protein